MSAQSKRIEWYVKEMRYRESRRSSFSVFIQHVMPSIEMTCFHTAYYEILDLFARGDIRRLIISVPPQHGKSLASTQMLPAYLLGKNGSKKIAIASYSATLATKFNRRVQRTISEPEYKRVFSTRTKEGVSAQDGMQYTQTADYVEIVGNGGYLMSCGRGGSLTGNSVDVMILDDLYKDAMEANSPLIRENTFEWYSTVARTRLHNNSQELIVFTRWHEEDLIGRLLAVEPSITLNNFEQLDGITPETWVVVNFEAIKTGAPTGIDQRNQGEALWENKHSLESLLRRKELDRIAFECLYQGNPQSSEGQLYGDNFSTYIQLPTTIKKGNYTDTADMGDDYLCSVCYEVDNEGIVYVTDVLYTQESMELTEQATAQMLMRNNTKDAVIESNNGGRGFARAVEKLLSTTVSIEWLHQSENKESRILTNASTVQKIVKMPADWKIRWGVFFEHVTMYKRNFKSNKYHDAVDVLTGIVEIESREKLDYGRLAKLQRKLTNVTL